MIFKRVDSLFRRFLALFLCFHLFLMNISIAQTPIPTPTPTPTVPTLDENSIHAVPDNEVYSVNIAYTILWTIVSIVQILSVAVPCPSLSFQMLNKGTLVLSISEIVLTVAFVLSDLIISSAYQRTPEQERQKEALKISADLHKNKAASLFANASLYLIFSVYFFAVTIVAIWEQVTGVPHIAGISCNPPTEAQRGLAKQQYFAIITKSFGSILKIIGLGLQEDPEKRKAGKYVEISGSIVAATSLLPKIINILNKILDKFQKKKIAMAAPGRLSESVEMFLYSAITRAVLTALMGSMLAALGGVFIDAGIKLQNQATNLMNMYNSLPSPTPSSTSLDNWWPRFLSWITAYASVPDESSLLSSLSIPSRFCLDKDGGLDFKCECIHRSGCFSLGKSIPAKIPQKGVFGESVQQFDEVMRGNLGYQEVPLERTKEQAKTLHRLARNLMEQALQKQKNPFPRGFDYSLDEASLRKMAVRFHSLLPQEIIGLESVEKSMTEVASLDQESPAETSSDHSDILASSMPTKSQQPATKDHFRNEFEDYAPHRMASIAQGASADQKEQKGSLENNEFVQYKDIYQREFHYHEINSDPSESIWKLVSVKYMKKVVDHSLNIDIEGIEDREDRDEAKSDID